ncbi:MAG: sigma-54-dependent Fis family transcriptional regulator [Deltaproteobacteria bacterium]|nr:sigma-54-dependent Fis family transcriptional regulator [Deltaproteobacteria bacterium]
METANLQRLPILVVDDDKITRELLRGFLEYEGFRVFLAGSGEEALELLRGTTCAVVFSDIQMAGVGGFELLSLIKNSDPNAIVVLMTSFGSMEGAVEGIRAGAFDYISKPIVPDELRAIVHRAYRHWDTIVGEASRRQTQNTESALTVPRTLIGKSKRIIEVYKTLAKATLSSSNVLIIGESGTGKELVAKAIHDNSDRRNKRFIAVNCGALAETLLESELFGHIKGSFTGAIANKRGLFEEANGGTIFLDEIGDINLGLQVKLLRVIQEGEFKPVGSSETRRVDVRLIAATHRDLQAYVQTGKFREDLYYRLKVISVELPPLRDRMEDLPELISHFLKRFSKKSDKVVNAISDQAMACLHSYAWPGNIRELEHAIERAVAMTSTSILYPEDFPAEIVNFQPTADNRMVALEMKSTEVRSLEEMEREHILRVLAETKFNKSRAAGMLGIDRATLYRKAQRYGIRLDSAKRIAES